MCFSGKERVQMELKRALCLGGGIGKLCFNDFILLTFGACDIQCQFQASLVPCRGLNTDSTGHGLVCTRQHDTGCVWYRTCSGKITDVTACPVISVHVINPLKTEFLHNYI
jgi:hypothetical protein